MPKSLFTGNGTINPLASISKPSPRHSKPGYEERMQKRRQQKAPTKAQKKLTILKGRAHPPAPGVGVDREKNWNGTWISVSNESIMRGRGLTRKYQRESSID